MGKNEILSKSKRYRSDSSDPIFHLCNSSLKRVNAVIKCYFDMGNTRIETIVTRTKIPKSMVSLIHSFLKDIDVLTGKIHVKGLTSKGITLGNALTIHSQEEIKKSWQDIIKNNYFCTHLLKELRNLGDINIARNMFWEQIYKSAGYGEKVPRDTKMGANALINIFLLAGYISKHGKYFKTSDTIDELSPVIRPKLTDANNFFIAAEIISELERIQNRQYCAFDLSRLIQYCEEINDNFHSENYSSVAFLCRAILDHCPPVFGKLNFESIVAQEKRGNSLQKVASHLNQSLKNIADHHIHKQIGEKEVLPGPEEVDFSSDMNFLIGRIIETIGEK